MYDDNTPMPRIMMAASLLTYNTISNIMFSKRQPNKVPCAHLDGRSRTNWLEIHKSFSYQKYCRDMSCWNCGYQQYIYNTQRYKRKLINPYC